jgi:hypothetical protein
MEPLLVVLVNPVGGTNTMVDLTKVEQRREEAIQRAVNTDDWAKVDNLLNQSYENLCRKDRSYGLCSLYSSSIDKGSLLDKIADDNDALSLLIKKEEIAIINDAIESLLSDRDREILFGVVFENKSFSHLAKEVRLSDKTVKRHYERILEILRKELKN